MYRYLLIFKRLMVEDAADGGADKGLGFLRGLFGIFGYPGAVLADVGHLEIIRVKPAFLYCPSECGFMHLRRARSYYDPVDTELFNIFLYEVLPGIGAHEFIIPRNDHGGQSPGEFGYFLDVYNACNIAAAVTDINTDFGFHYDLLRKIAWLFILVEANDSVKIDIRTSA